MYKPYPMYENPAKKRGGRKMGQKARRSKKNITLYGYDQLYSTSLIKNDFLMTQQYIGLG